MRILIVTGSSGGHIFPALALAEALNNPSHKLLLVLPQKSKEDKISSSSVEIKYIHAANLNFNLNSKNISNVFFFLQGAWQGLRIIIKFKPDVVVGFGSLNTVALVFWAWFFRIKTVIHEQNVIPGRANRLLSRLADKVAVSFSQTNKYLNISPKKIVLTGNPLRSNLVRKSSQEALDFFKFKEGKFNLLITGGSQGAQKLNSVCFEALAALPKKDELQVIHICGAKDFAVLKEKYAGLGLSCRVFDFISEMQYAYSIAGLIICRAGASTIADLQRFKVPAILIPYPFAYAHQLANARILGDLKAALIISDEQLTAESLNDKLQEFLEDPHKLEVMRQAYAQSKVEDAAQLLAKEVVSAF